MLSPRKFFSLCAQLVSVLTVAGLLSACGNDGGTTAAGGTAARTSEQGTQAPFKILVFSKTAGFRHYSIPIGVATLQQLGSANGFEVVATEDDKVFTPENLKQYAAVVWLNTTGIVLTDNRQRKAFEDYMAGGGGFVGIHSAADTEYEWKWYETLVGARFKCHPLQQTATLINEAVDHPSTAHFAKSFTTFDEFYSFNRSPRKEVKVLLSIDEASYMQNPNTSNLPDSPTFPQGVNGTMGDHPMSWCHRNTGGIAWYTALGHEGTQYASPDYQQHILNGVMVAAGRVQANCQ